MIPISIREFKLAIVKALISTAVLSGTSALILGSASCFVGLTGVATIKLAERLNPYHNVLKVMMFYGTSGVGVGLFSIGVGVAISKYLGSPKTVEELLEENGESEKFRRTKLAACVGCKHFHGNVYNGAQVVCGLHPYGHEREQCPDWEAHPILLINNKP